MRRFLPGGALPAFAALPLVLGGPASAANIVTSFSNGFWIKRGPTPATDPGILYGPTDTNATWQINQWNNPTSQLQPFVSVACSESHQTNCFLAQSPDVSAYQFSSDGSYVSLPGNTPVSAGTRLIRLQSQGINMPCSPSAGIGGAPYELDTLISPNNANYPNYPQAFVATPVVGTLTSLVFNATVTFKYVAQNVIAGQPVTGGCAVVQHNNPQLGITLSNSTSSQTLFYQVKLAYNGFNPGSTAGGAWFSNSNPYGYGDVAQSYGLPGNYAPAGVTTVISLDMATQIKSIISGATNGMNAVPANWTVAGMYVGHVTYGQVGMVSEWSNVSLVGTP